MSDELYPSYGFNLCVCVSEHDAGYTRNSQGRRAATRAHTLCTFVCVYIRESICLSEEVEESDDVFSLHTLKCLPVFT